MARRTAGYWVYILANVGGPAATLYIGMTNDLERRLWEHRHPEPGPDRFTARYRLTRLVYVEEFVDVREAIAREKTLKGWRRSRKLALIEAANPEWRDLGEGWVE